VEESSRIGLAINAAIAKSAMTVNTIDAFGFISLNTKMGEMSQPIAGDMPATVNEWFRMQLLVSS
jgi:hypothetical protein